MKNKIIFLILFICNCENFGVLGTGGVSGKVVKSELREVIQQNAFLNWGSFGSRLGIPINLLLPSIILTFTIDSVLINGLEGIRDSEKYSRPSVDECKKNISDLGLLFTANGSVTISGAVATVAGNAIAPIPTPSVLASLLSCNLRKAPEVLQIGDGDSGKWIQIGPVGL